ncbi:cation transporter [Desulfobulbus sp. AH-315-M07]|nr:cation transporter [Desulfobulbus sp. AH-315-M07]
MKSKVCAGCSGQTKRIDPVTILSLTKESARDRVGDGEGYRFCPAADCSTVYTHESATAAFVTDDLTVEVFQKSERPERLLCYCFDYSVADVQADPDASLTFIEDKCRDGLDRCEEENPQGRCCLGNVRQVAASRDEEDCSAPAVESTPGERIAASQRSVEKQRRAGGWAAGGAVMGAILSSACCWLPLALVGVGVSAGGAGVFFEAYRFHFLAATAALLGAGFYFVYIRKPECAPGDVCEVPNPKLQRFNKIMLWVATAFVVSFALFPNYVGYLLGGGGEPTALAADPPSAANATGAITRDYDVVGMTCEGCTVQIQTAVGDVPGVTAVGVDYEAKLTRVTFAPGAEINDRDVIATIAELGYEATLSTPGAE